MKLEGTGYVIRTLLGNGFHYWTGAYKESRWDRSFYMAKLYKERARAESAIKNHFGDMTWENAEIITIQFR